MVQRIINILKDYTEVPSEKIIPESRLIEDLGFNSLDLMNIMIAFEEDFDIDIPETDISELYTVGNVAEYLQKRKHEK